MRVSLAQARPPSSLGTSLDVGEQTRSLARPLLAEGGPRVILGGQPGSNGLAQPIVPGPSTMFGPRGACLATPDGPLFVCDTGHHRLLVWHRTPASDHTPADLLIGQPDFSREGRNAKAEVGAATFNVPTGVAAVDGVLAVADAWNHRVLLWFGYPDTSNHPADVVLGQADFRGGVANRGAAGPEAGTLNWCYGVVITRGHLIVADTGNRRVLVWDRIPMANGTPADLVLGQRDFTTRDENAGCDAGPLGMRWPHGIVVVDNAILVVDAGNNRVMAWRNFPASNGVPCDFVFGQPDTASVDHNRAAYSPTAGTMNMPYGLTVLGDRIVVADTANSRLLGFDAAGLGMAATASWLTGQRAFTDKGDNRWGPPVRDSLCWPYAVAGRDETLVVADSGNNRVLLWDAAP
jgi:hypothetical protein